MKRVQLLDGDGDGHEGTGEGRVGGAGGFALDGWLDAGEIVLQGAEKGFEAEAAQLLGVAEQLAGEIGVAVMGAAGVGAMAGAESFAAFGNAAAFAAGFVEVLTFVDHEGPPWSKEKGPARNQTFCFFHLSSE